MLKKYGFSFAIFGLALAGVHAALAATPVNLKHQPMIFLQSFVAADIAAKTQLKEVSRSEDFRNTSHIKLKQTYSGYPVWGGDVIVHVPEGAHQTVALQKLPLHSSMNGLIYQDLQQDLHAVPDYIFNRSQADRALQTAKSLYQKNGKVKGLFGQEKVNLMVYVDKKNKAHWAFFVNFFVKPSAGQPARPVYILDAIHFQVYKTWDEVKTLDNVQGGGFGGNVKIGKKEYNGIQGGLPTLTMLRDAKNKKCYLKNADVSVLSLKDSSIGKQISFPCNVPDSNHHNLYWDADLGAVNAGYSPENDALYAGGIIKNMYRDWYHLDVLDNKVLKMKVHNRDPYGIDNAFWDGDAMTFGDGEAYFYPLVSLDVGGHEISHGFTEFHSNLVYEGQSGGLNESFSDMAGVAAGFYATGSSQWQIGADIFKE